jgi:TonB family protein
VLADTPPKTVSVSAGVTQGLLIRKIAPVYPSEAKHNGIQGTVVLKAVIGKDGRIKDLRAVSGPKELYAASIGAVQQWQYRPYLLLGQPVQVDTMITVNFQLR